ncbi:MAG: hypothetical protein V1898_03505 [Patescibacteria group bacterium]
MVEPKDLKRREQRLFTEKEKIQMRADVEALDIDKLRAVEGVPPHILDFIEAYKRGEPQDTTVSAWKNADHIPEAVKRDLDVKDLIIQLNRILIEDSVAEDRNLSAQYMYVHYLDYLDRGFYYASEDEHGSLKFDYAANASVINLIDEYCPSDFLEVVLKKLRQQVEDDIVEYLVQQYGNRGMHNRFYRDDESGESALAGQVAPEPPDDPQSASELAATLVPEPPAPREREPQAIKATLHGYSDTGSMRHCKVAINGEKISYMVGRLYLPDAYDKPLDLSALNEKKPLMIKYNGLKDARGVVLPSKKVEVKRDGTKNWLSHEYYIELNGLEVADGLVFPEGVMDVQLRGLKTLRGLDIPSDREFLDIHIGKIPKEEIRALNATFKGTWLKVYYLSEDGKEAHIELGGVSSGEQITAYNPPPAGVPAEPQPTPKPAAPTAVRVEAPSPDQINRARVDVEKYYREISAGNGKNIVEEDKHQRLSNLIRFFNQYTEDNFLLLNALDGLIRARFGYWNQYAPAATAAQVLETIKIKAEAILRRKGGSRFKFTEQDLDQAFDCDVEEEMKRIINVEASAAQANADQHYRRAVQVFEAAGLSIPTREEILQPKAQPTSEIATAQAVEATPKVVGGSREELDGAEIEKRREAVQSIERVLQDKDTILRHKNISDIIEKLDNIKNLFTDNVSSQDPKKAWLHYHYYLFLYCKAALIVAPNAQTLDRQYYAQALKNNYDANHDNYRGRIPDATVNAEAIALIALSELGIDAAIESFFKYAAFIQSTDDQKAVVRSLNAKVKECVRKVHPEWKGVEVDDEAFDIKDPSALRSYLQQAKRQLEAPPVKRQEALAASLLENGQKVKIGNRVYEIKDGKLNLDDIDTPVDLSCIENADSSVTDISLRSLRTARGLKVPNNCLFVSLDGLTTAADLDVNNARLVSLTGLTTEKGLDDLLASNPDTALIVPDNFSDRFNNMQRIFRSEKQLRQAPPEQAEKRERTKIIQAEPFKVGEKRYVKIKDRIFDITRGALSIPADVDGTLDLRKLHRQISELYIGASRADSLLLPEGVTDIYLPSIKSLDGLSLPKRIFEFDFDEPLSPDVRIFVRPDIEKSHIQAYVHALEKDRGHVMVGQIGDPSNRGEITWTDAENDHPYVQPKTITGEDLYKRFFSQTWQRAFRPREEQATGSAPAEYRDVLTAMVYEKVRSGCGYWSDCLPAELARKIYVDLVNQVLEFKKGSPGAVFKKQMDAKSLKDKTWEDVIKESIKKQGRRILDTVDYFHDTFLDPLLISFQEAGDDANEDLEGSFFQHDEALFESFTRMVGNEYANTVYDIINKTVKADYGFWNNFEPSATARKILKDVIDKIDLEKTRMKQESSKFNEQRCYGQTLSEFIMEREYEHSSSKRKKAMNAIEALASIRQAVQSS